MASSSEAAPAPVHGLLRKWVNFGKLYRPRYFILRDGTLQYLKARPSRRCSAPRCAKGRAARHASASSPRLLQITPPAR